MTVPLNPNMFFRQNKYPFPTDDKVEQVNVASFLVNYFMNFQRSKNFPPSCSRNANSFPRAKPRENCELQRTVDDVQICASKNF